MASPTCQIPSPFTLMDRTYIKKVSNGITNMIYPFSLHPLGQDLHQEGEQCHHQHVRSLLPSPSSTDRTYINKVSNVIPNLSDPFSLHPHGQVLRIYIKKVSNVITNISDPFSLHPHGHWTGHAIQMWAMPSPRKVSGEQCYLKGTNVHINQDDGTNMTEVINKVSRWAVLFNNVSIGQSCATVPLKNSSWPSPA